MNKDELNKKRLKPCVAEIYMNAKGPTNKCYPQSYDTWAKHGVWAFYDNMNNPITIVPLDCYYLDNTTLRKIVAKWSKGLHGFWYYIPKLTHGEPDYDAHVKELHDFREFEEKVSFDTSLSYAQRAAKIKKEALSHNFMWRSKDKEYINFNVYLGVAPNSNWDWVKKNHMIFQAIETAANSGRLKNIYIDYVNTNEFEFPGNDGKIYHAKIEAIRYHRHNKNGDTFVQKETPGQEFCNLYDDEGNFVTSIWDHIDVRRKMSASSMENMVKTYKPVIYEILKSQGNEDLVEWLENHSYMDKDLKQCLAVWIMSQWFLAENKSNPI